MKSIWREHYYTAIGIPAPEGCLTCSPNLPTRIKRDNVSLVTPYGHHIEVEKQNVRSTIQTEPAGRICRCSVSIESTELQDRVTDSSLTPERSSSPTVCTDTRTSVSPPVDSSTSPNKVSHSTSQLSNCPAHSCDITETPAKTCHLTNNTVQKSHNTAAPAEAISSNHKTDSNREVTPQRAPSRHLSQRRHRILSEMTVEEVDVNLLQDKHFLDSQFCSKYEPKEVLGRGLCSTVRRCIEKCSQVSYAVKIIDLTQIDNSNQVLEAGHNEINLLQSCCDQPNIIRLHESFKTPAFLFLVFELCPNGELFDLLTTKVRLSEKRSRTIMKQLLEAVSFLHSKNIMHRDIKCENILLDEMMNVKLSDFGFATKIDDSISYRELLGTPGYLSPEMLKANTDKSYPSYGEAVDMWACGVVFYTLIAGRAPFYNRRVVYMLREIKDGKYSFPSSDWEEISWECKDLVKRMLTVNPANRITAKEALLHPFFEIQEVDHDRTAIRRVKCVFHVVRFLIRLKILAAAPKPLSMATLSSQPYKHKPLRKLIDEAAFNIYGHWVQRSDEQNRGALFQCHPKPHETSGGNRIRLLSGTDYST